MSYQTTLTLEEYQRLPTRELLHLALQTKLAHRGDRFSLCSIINAKSGRCSEDCRFCVQSGRYATGVEVYPLKSRQELVAAAQEAKNIGAGHFSLVTSGRGLTGSDLDQAVQAVAAIREEVGIKVCGSLGILDRPALASLRGAGLSRYHHNLETSREYFPRIATTHTFEERLETIRAAQEAGLEVCAGGIIGMGESEADWFSLARTLRECRVDSVPLNILMPLQGTPLAQAPPLPVAQILRAIALFRLLLPELPIRLAAGRESALGDFLGSAFLAGADGMMIGGYLTQRGRLPEEDHRLVARILEIWNG